MFTIPACEARETTTLSINAVTATVATLRTTVTCVIYRHANNGHMILHKCYVAGCEC